MIEKSRCSTLFHFSCRVGVVNGEKREIGAGDSVTVLCEVLTPAQAQRLAGVAALKYQTAETKGTGRATSKTDAPRQGGGGRWW